MSENENQESTIAVILCKNGCGFYGSTQFDGMCSVCHKEAMKKRQRQDEDQIQKPVASPHAAAALLCASASNNYGNVPLDPDDGKDGKKGGLGSATGLPGSFSTSAESDMSAMQQQQQQQSTPASFAHPGETTGSAAAANTNEDSHGALGAALSAIPSSIAALSTNDRDSQSSSLDTDGSTSTTDSCQQKRRIRCGMCKKKVGLTGFECRCGGVFCSAHRYSDKHSCAFDYQSHGQEQIRKANPQVVSSKIDKL